MRLCSRWAVVTVLSAAVFAGCDSDSKKIGDGGTPDTPILDAALADSAGPDLRLSEDSADAGIADASNADAGIADASPAQLDGGAADSPEGDAPLLADAQELDVLSRSEVSMIPASASFATVFGTASAPIVFNIRATGEAPSVTIAGPDKNDFILESNCDQWRASGEVRACQVIVFYSPKVVPATNSTATLTVSLPDGASGSAPLVGTVVPTDEAPSITGTSIDFGSVVVGSTSTALTFTMTNYGSAVVNMEVSASPAQFAIATDNCTGKDTPVSASCTFTVEFKPTAENWGIVDGRLKVAFSTDSSFPAFLAVYGNAIPQAQLALDPKVLEFGTLPIAQESQPQTLTVSNTGGAPTGALKIEQTGAEFAIKDDTCTGKSLTGEGTTKTCTITVTYTPAQAAEATGSIVITDTSGAAAAPVTASLHGKGVPQALALSPTAVCPQNEADDPLCIPSASTNRFNNMTVGQTSPEIPLVLSYLWKPEDAPDSGAISFTFEGEAAADFVVAKNDCLTPLISTTRTCTLSVTFKPSAAGLRKAVLNATSSRGGSAQTTLEGKGLT